MTIQRENGDNKPQPYDEQQFTNSSDLIAASQRNRPTFAFIILLVNGDLSFYI